MAKRYTMGVLSLLVLLQASIECAKCDLWGPPKPYERLSEDGSKAVRIEPGELKNAISERKQVRAATLTVSSVQDDTRFELWSMELVNSIEPLDAAVSNDGAHVITFDNYGGAGYGDKVVVLYSRGDVLASYALKDLLGEAIVKQLRENANEWDRDDDLDSLLLLSRPQDMPFRRSVSSIWWRDSSIGFFDQAGNAYCLWLSWRDWLSWDLTTGKLIAVDAEQATRWNRQLREIALARIQSGEARQNVYLALGELHVAEDRQVLENALQDDRFYTMVSRGDRGSYYGGYSLIRHIADRVLTRWDDPQASIGDPYADNYTQLGVLKFTGVFPKRGGQPDHKLLIYLQQADDARPATQLYKASQYMVVDLGSYGFRKSTQTIDGDGDHPTIAAEFKLFGVQPGEYVVRVIWDRGLPLHKEGSLQFQAGLGDFHSTTDVPVRIQAGLVTDAGEITCTTLVRSQ